MKKYLALPLAVIMSFVSLAPALANENRGNSHREVVQIKKELKQEVKDERNEIKDQIKELQKTLRFAPKSLTLVGKLVTINSTSTSSTVITVSLDRVMPEEPRALSTSTTTSSTLSYPVKNSNITLVINGDTDLIRAYGGKMAVSEMSVGDELHIIAKFNSDGSLSVRIVKDNSLHTILNKRGTVQSINAGNLTFVLKQEDRNLTVHTDSDTKFVLRGNTTTQSFASLQVGDRVKVDGIINTNLLTVNASKVVIAQRSTSTTPSN